jgi:RNA polymerase sigma-70 factor (sigma-E family)
MDAVTSGRAGGDEVENEVAIETARSTRLAELYAAHAERTGRLAFLLTGDRELARDLAQEAFARLVTRLAGLRKAEAVDAYLRRSVVNLARNHWRRLGRERTFLRREGPAIACATVSQPEVADREAVWEALSRLPYRQRAALVLRFYEDLSERQTASTLGCAVGTVKSLVSRGLESLRSEMGGDPDDR